MHKQTLKTISTALMMATAAHIAQAQVAPPEAPSGDSQVPWQGLPPLIKRSRSIMSTTFEITVVDASSGKDLDAYERTINKAFTEIERIEDLMSEWRPKSEVSQVNQLAGIKPSKVSQDTLKVVITGLESSRFSHGAFDMTWAALRDMYLFQPGEEKIPTQNEIKTKLPLVRYQDVIVDEKASTIFLKRKGMALGLGGIAKGYALDKASDILKLGGLRNFTIFGGGQVFVAGSRGPRPWRVGIQHPRRSDYIAYVETKDGSVATSGDYEHAFFRDGKRWHHIIDPKTGYPVQHTVSVTIVAPTGLYADAIDNGVFVLGAKKGIAMLKKLPFKVEAVVIDSDFRVHTTEGIKTKLVWKAKLKDGKIPIE
jgi:thiamine biosynthesis lipoprotein